MTVYEGMFLLDNELVRAGWAQAKGTVSALIEKHGGAVHTSRRWGERRLAYRIKRKNRATFLLAHYEMPTASIPGFTRDLEISEPILRYLFLKVAAVPEQELELARAEESGDFVVPEPPTDEFEEVEQVAERRPRKEDDSDDSSDDDDAEPVLAGADSDESTES